MPAEGQETAKDADSSKVADQVKEAGKLADGEHLCMTLSCLLAKAHYPEQLHLSQLAKQSQVRRCCI